MGKSDSDYSIHEVAEKLHVSVQMLRRWDQNGLLKAERTDGNHRRYQKHRIDLLAAGKSDPDSLGAELVQFQSELAEKTRVIQLLRESEARYRDLVETSHDLIWAVDAECRFTYLNHTSLSIFGKPPAEMIGQNVLQKLVSEDFTGVSLCERLFVQSEVQNYVARLQMHGAAPRWLSISGRTITDPNGLILGARGSARDITDEHVALEQLKHAATHDRMTGLPNRDMLEFDIGAAVNETCTPGALLFLDFDGFRHINDRFGHHVGDRLMKDAVNVLLATAASIDAKLYRIGSDSYAMLLRRRARAQISSCAQKVLDAMVRHIPSIDEDTPFTRLSLSIGAAIFPFHGVDCVALMSKAEIAMYQAKDRGRNRCVIYGKDLTDIRDSNRRVGLDRMLRDAIQDDRIVLFGQPVVRVEDQRVEHYDVLARICDPDGEILPMEQFKEVAADPGLARELDLCVTRQLLDHLGAGAGGSATESYFVIVSQSSMFDKAWVSYFINLIAAADLHTRKRLVFKIHKLSALLDVDATRFFISELRKLDCRFMLDDFGAGSMSFECLQQFDAEFVRINGGLTKDIAVNPLNALFAKAILDVALGLGKTVVAERVEATETLEAARKLGVQYYQGFLFKEAVELFPAAGRTTRAIDASGDAGRETQATG